MRARKDSEERSGMKAAEPESLHAILGKDSLTKAEADSLLSGLDKKRFLEQLVATLKYKHFMTDDEIATMFQPSEQGTNIPLSILANGELSALESICRYLKEKGYRYSEIAKLLNRDQRTIWVTYHNSIKKQKEPLLVPESKYTLNPSIFQDRNLSILEAVVRHLKDTHNLRYVDIAGLINRDERNVWDLYHKAGQKMKT